MTVELKGRIDSGNAAEVEDSLREQVAAGPGGPLVFDAKELEYISSAGLRILLHFKKSEPDLKIINVTPEVYEILEMTGFTEIIKVEKSYRVVSIEGCEEIGHGANGTIYRIDQDSVVKVYNNADALEDIQHEREVARTALVLGIPTAISYDVVRVGDSYGSVFELLNARSFSKILATEPEKMDWCVDEYVDMLKLIHSTVVPKGKLPDIRETVIDWAVFMQDHLPEETGRKLLSMVEAIPEDDHMIHGDYHTGNLQLQGDEVLLIDMDTLAVGHPVIELASIFNAFVGFYEARDEGAVGFLGFDKKVAGTFWNKVLAAYLGTDNQEKLKSVEDKARIIGYTRLIRRSIRRNGLETEEGRAEIDHWKKELIELVEKTDTLDYLASELELDASIEELDRLIAFIDHSLEGADCSPKCSMQIELAVEEIFSNICNYAYEGEEGDDGKVTIRTRLTREDAIEITFLDRGTPYDPLARKDPDVTLSAKEREIGGLGIFLTKKTMDSVTYEYRDGMNVLAITKNLR